MTYDHALRLNALVTGQVLVLVEPLQQGADPLPWLTEIAQAYCGFKHAGYDVTLAALHPEGGAGTQQALSSLQAAEASPPELARFLTNPQALQQLHHLVALDAVLEANEPPPESAYAALLLLSGGPGAPGSTDPAYHLHWRSSTGLALLVGCLYGAGRVVGATGRGLAGLAGAEAPSAVGGGPLVAGLKLAFPPEAAGAPGGEEQAELRRRLVELGARLITDTPAHAEYAVAASSAPPTAAAGPSAVHQTHAHAPGQPMTPHAVAGAGGAVNEGAGGCIVSGADACAVARVVELMLHAVARCGAPLVSSVHAGDATALPLRCLLPGVKASQHGDGGAKNGAAQGP